ASSRGGGRLRGANQSSLCRLAEAKCERVGLRHSTSGSVGSVMCLAGHRASPQLKKVPNETRLKRSRSKRTWIRNPAQPRTLRQTTNRNKQLARLW
ncbi:unnamed protein product, partial [Ectocarpus sp. 13 AM-2016]